MTDEIVWTFEQYQERIAHMKAIGMSNEQIHLVLECVTITHTKPLFFISEE